MPTASWTGRPTRSRCCARPSDSAIIARLCEVRAADGAAIADTGADHDVDGAAIAAADHETLRDLGFTTVGHRLSLLRAVYDIKCREGLPIDDDWLPPCA